uniref:hypothetical protein n=1 Tax=Agathobacter sp. TaxID=2021311 RepID=UPI0040566078
MYHGAGTTSVSLALCNFLSGKQRKKTAYVELNASDEIRFLKRGTKKECFHYMGFALYPNATLSSLPDILQADFEYFILDMGVLNTYTAREFSHCHKQFIIGSLTNWKRQKTLEQIDSLLKNNMIQQDKVTFIRVSDKKESTFSIFPKPFAKIVNAPYFPNPFQISYESFGFFQRILN